MTDMSKDRLCHGLVDGVHGVAMRKDVRLCVWVCVPRVRGGATGAMKGCRVWQLLAVPLRKERWVRGWVGRWGGGGWGCVCWGQQIPLLSTPGVCAARGRRALFLDQILKSPVLRVCPDGIGPRSELPAAECCEAAQRACCADRVSVMYRYIPLQPSHKTPQLNRVSTQVSPGPVTRSCGLA